MSADQPIGIGRWRPRLREPYNREPSLGEHKADQLKTPERHALAGDRGVDHLVIVVVAKDTFWLEVFPSLTGQPLAPPEPRAVSVLELKQDLLFQLFLRIEGRQAERRMCHRGHCFAEQTQGTCRYILGRPVTDREIEFDRRASRLAD